MLNARSSLLPLLLLVGGCPATDTTDGGTVGDGGSSVSDSGATGFAGTGSTYVGDGGTYELDCPHGGAIGKIHVEFDCDELTVYSCKDISNVVLEFSDGSRQRYENGFDQIEAFGGSGSNAGKTIVGVWVKAGNNKSGDGPGYGERFDAPDVTCDDGTAGTGGLDDCADNDPDTLCEDGSSGTGGTTGGTGGTTGGTGGTTGGTGGTTGGTSGTGGLDSCADNDPDTLCEEGSNPDEDPTDFCASHPQDPACSAD